ncbi:MAG: hypothetical protein K2K80_07175 [Clostridia bacterium]|nr:hypothetical protein [Clostridia bacterium]
MFAADDQTFFGIAKLCRLAVLYCENAPAVGNYKSAVGKYILIRYTALYHLSAFNFNKLPA